MEQMHANHTLAHFLVHTGACSQEVADEFRQTARKNWKPLGLFLRETCGLSLKDIARVLGEQAMRPTMLFGDLAVELGVCTREQIDAARTMQRQECPHVLDMALADPRVDRDKCLAALRDYVRFTERMLDQLGQQYPAFVAALANGSLV